MNKDKNISGFEAFLDYVRENIKDYIEGIEDYRVQIIPMIKNNHVVMEGLQIANTSDPASPVIYLEGFYEAFCMGTDIHCIMETVAHIYEESKTMKGYVDPEKITDFRVMRDRIILRLVNGERNQEVLSNCPHRFMSDLAVTYRVLVGKNEDGISTMLISNTLMEEWGVDEQQLYDLARENSLCLFPPVVEKLSDMMENTLGISLSRLMEEAEKEENFQLYILTNDIKINGASAASYSDALEWFAKKVQNDFYVIPSSIHELLLVPVTEYIDPDYVQSVIRDVNQQVVLEEEILSDNLYVYDVKEKKMCKYEAD